MKKVMVFGNPLIKEDSLAVDLSKEIKIKNIEFIKCESSDDILSLNESEVTILDVIEGIDKPVLIEDIDKLKLNKSVTAHDFDLGFSLKLMKGMGKIKNIKIIGIPQKGDKERIKKEVKDILNSLRF